MTHSHSHTHMYLGVCVYLVCIVKHSLKKLSMSIQYIHIYLSVSMTYIYLFRCRHISICFDACSPMCPVLQIGSWYVGVYLETRTMLVCILKHALKELCMYVRYRQTYVFFRQLALPYAGRLRFGWWGSY